MCTVYQKNTVINIAVTPLLSAWRPKNYQAKAVIVLYHLTRYTCMQQPLAYIFQTLFQHEVFIIRQH
jgi:hypothetical protein